MRGVMRQSSYTAFAFLAVVIMVCSSTSWGRRLARGFFSPFANVWRSGEEMAGGLLDNLLPRTSSRRQRMLELELRIHELEARLAQVSQLEKANVELRQMLQLPEFPSWKAVAADVISRDPTQWNKGFVINKGLSDQVSAGAIVLSGTFVIGRITESNRHSAQVATVAAPECRFSVLVEGTDSVGICIGSNSGDWRGEPRFQVDFLPGDLQVSAGQRVLTSGLGGGIPGGLPVGEVIADDDGHTLQVIANSRGRLLCRLPKGLQSIRHVIVLCPVLQGAGGA